MATRSFYAKLNANRGDNTYLATVSEDGADIVSAVATLVADGATPTQAHVTALTTAIARQGDVVLLFNTTNITTLTQLRAAVAALLQQAAGNGMVL